MSDVTFIIPTEFKDLSDGTTTRGLRVYDEYAAGYEVFESQTPTDDLEILKMALCGTSKECLRVLEFVEEMKRGVIIGKTHYEWTEIAPIYDSLTQCAWCMETKERSTLTYRNKSPICPACVSERG